MEYTFTSDNFEEEVLKAEVMYLLTFMEMDVFLVRH